MPLTVVLSQTPSKDPARHKLQEDIVARLLGEPGIELGIVPHLYDLVPDHTGTVYLQSVQGPMVVLSWLYPRPAFWTLYRLGVRGRWGAVLLQQDEDEQAADDPLAQPAVPELIDQGPDRAIYCIGLTAVDDLDQLIAEIRRIRDEQAVETVPLKLPSRSPEPVRAVNGQLPRRWYPVIDYSRCTNCMECIDFCLFGVYGVDGKDRILVEQPDNCRRGCPACSRVCPEHAIMFPMHKTPAIAGALAGDPGALKIDLSRLFGGEDPLSLAMKERDRELIKAGRAPVGPGGAGASQPATRTQPTERDELDDLIDQLESMEL